MRRSALSAHVPFSAVPAVSVSVRERKSRRALDCRQACVAGSSPPCRPLSLLSISTSPRLEPLRTLHTPTAPLSPVASTRPCSPPHPHLDLGPRQPPFPHHVDRQAHPPRRRAAAAERRTRLVLGQPRPPARTARGAPLEGDQLLDVLARRLVQRQHLHDRQLGRGGRPDMVADVARRLDRVRVRGMLRRAQRLRRSQVRPPFVVLCGACSC